MKKEEYKNIFILENNHWWYQGMQKISRGLLAPIVKNKNNLAILDAGCGTGGMMVSLSQFGQVWGIDISPEALAFCRRRKLKNVKLASVEKIPFENETFDLITSFDVLYHQWVKDDTQALNEFFRVLKPGGYVLLRVSAYNWLRGKHDKIVATRHRYSKKELCQKTKKSGFIISRATYANTILFPAAFFMRLLENFSSREENSDIKPTTKMVNQVLKNILFLEAFLIRRLNLPFGLSLFVLAQKPR